MKVSIFMVVLNASKTQIFERRIEEEINPFMLYMFTMCLYS